jgi:hypothetical protein
MLHSCLYSRDNCRAKCTPVWSTGLNILFHIAHILLALMQTDAQMCVAKDSGLLMNYTL